MGALLSDYHEYCNNAQSYVPYSGKLLREKMVKSTIFAEKAFVDCLLLPHQRTPHRPTFHGENFANSHKTMKFTKVFSLKSFPLYDTVVLRFAIANSHWERNSRSIKI